MCRDILEQAGPSSGAKGSKKKQNPQKASPGKALFDKASAILGYDLAGVCLNGPEERLTSTAVSQPAVLVASLAALEDFKARRPEVWATVGHMAGFSLGEYTALVAAGALSFEDGVKLVKTRAEAMQAASEKCPGTMGSIVGLEDADLNAIVAEVLAENPGAVLQVANLLFPKGRVISGHHSAVDAALAKATAKNALKAQRLVVGGAFHTSCMADAQEAVKKALEGVTLTLPPNVLVYSNVT
eukprot:RCo041660